MPKKPSPAITKRAAKPAAKPKAKRRQVDWESVERDYRAGIKTLREIAAGVGVSHVAIKKRADRDGWDRDLSAKIKAKAEALVTNAKVTKRVTKEAKASEAAVIDANAQAIAEVKLRHRKDIARAQNMARRLLEELETTTADPGLYAQVQGLVALTEGMSKKDADKLAAAVQKVLELPSRTCTMKMLADTMTKLVGLEREAYSLDSAKDTDKSDGVEQFSALMNRIDGAGTGLSSGHSQG